MVRFINTERGLCVQRLFCESGMFGWQLLAWHTGRLQKRHNIPRAGSGLLARLLLLWYVNFSWRSFTVSGDHESYSKRAWLFLIVNPCTPCLFSLESPRS